MNKKETTRKISTHIRAILELLGKDLKNPDLKGTPDRVAKMWYEEMVHKQPSNIFKVFPSGPKSDNQQMITLKGHTTYTRCPHHLERVEMIVTISYLPNSKGKILGLSKLARIADYFAEGLTLQEEYTDALANGLSHVLEADGVGVFVKANHNCMQARGIKTTASVITTALRGKYLEAPTVKQEFLDYCKGDI